MSTRIFTLLTVVVVTTSTLSCGGGGGGVATAPPPPPPVGELPITPANAQDITASVLEGISSLFELIEVSNVAGLPFPVQTVNLRLANLSGSPFAGVRAVGDRHKSTLMPSRDITTVTGNCDTGTFARTWDDVDNSLDITSGDSFDIAFNACFFADAGVTLAGAASVTNIVLTGDAINEIAPWSLAASFTFTNLQATDTTDAATLNGGLNLSVGTDDNLVMNVAITGTSLTAAENGTTATLSDFSVTEALDVNTMTITADAMGTLTSSELNGAVNFSTPASFVIIADDNPSAGQLAISDGNSGVLVSVLDNLNVELGIDANGDGTAETTIVVTWAALDID